LVVRLGAPAIFLALFVAWAGPPDVRDRPQAVGVIEGTVRLADPSPPRRSAQRYPGGAPAAGARQVTQLPAVAYLVGPIPGGERVDAARPTMSQRDTAFAPSIVPVRVGGTVGFPNRDPFFHNVFSYSSAQRFDLGRYPEGESKEVTFGEAGIVEVFCEVHEFMRGAIVVTENPYFAIVGADETFRIEGVPEGEHTITFWQQEHESLDRTVTVRAGGVTRVEVELRR